MNKETIQKIIEQLENIKIRPAMYFGRTDDFEATIHFFHGFNAAFFCCEGERKPSLNDRRQAHKKRGWEFTARNIAYEMKEKSFAHEEIVLELITIEIEAWKNLLETEN